MSDLVAMAYAVGNVISSVALVLLNKRVFSGGFVYPMTLSTFHFVFTIVFYQLLQMANFFSKPAIDMPQAEKFKVAFAGMASIGFMNLSLTYNSVGFYQITKLVIIPTTLIINYYFYSVSTTPKVKLSLLILLGGVGVATVTDVQLKPLGLAFGVAAVLTTAMFQIWQGTKQKDYGLSGTQLQSSIAWWQSAQAFAVAASTEFFCLGPKRCTTALDYFAEAAEPTHTYTLWLVLGTCFLALLVNFCSFGLIGRTSPITFQVVGHAKTCLVLIGGYVLFPAKAQDVQQFYNNIAGVTVAFIGVVLYGNIKYASGQGKDDCLDGCCPGPIVRALDPTKYSTVSPSETEGLTVSKS
jgi:solute carrier family 35 protein E3